MKAFKTNFKFFMIVIAAISLTLACSGEDGMDGIDGINGVDGIDGNNGADGADGTDGTDGNDGADGTDGADGADGNANVRVFTYDLSTVSGQFHDQSIPEITQQVFDNDVILGYVSPSNPNVLIPIPTVSSLLSFNISVFIEVGNYSLDFVDDSGTVFSISSGNLTGLRVVIIEATSNTSGKSSKKDIISELKEAGVDISDYYQVMDYFGMEY